MKDAKKMIAEECDEAKHYFGKLTDAIAKVGKHFQKDDKRQKKQD